MKRNRFITTVLAVAMVPAVTGFRSREKEGRTDKGFKAAAGEGRFHGHILLKGVNSNIMDLKVSGKDTDGDLAIFEQTSISQGRGTPLHVHYFQDEVFYVVEGKYYFQVGDEKVWLSQGECIFLPRKVPHAWTQVSEKGKMTITFQPAGKMEEFFMTMSKLSDNAGEPEIARIFTENDMKVVGPPLKVT
jgi:quercetin dioxygenase-like cupin family protein